MVLEFQQDLRTQREKRRPIRMFFEQLVDSLERRGSLLTLQHTLNAFEVSDDVLAAEFDFLAAATGALCV